MKKSNSVVHEWVSTLTLQQQALLFTGMRGPDSCSKHNNAKAMVRYLRGAVLKPAGRLRPIPGFNSGKHHFVNDNDFMWGDYRMFEQWACGFWNDHDEYPHHFIMHLIHCAQVIGYKHPDKTVNHLWYLFYKDACKSFHMKMETEQSMDKRLNDFK